MNPSFGVIWELYRGFRDMRCFELGVLFLGSWQEQGPHIWICFWGCVACNRLLIKVLGFRVWVQVRQFGTFSI